MPKRWFYSASTQLKCLPHNVLHDTLGYLKLRDAAGFRTASKWCTQHMPHRLLLAPYTLSYSLTKCEKDMVEWGGTYYNLYSDSLCAALTNNDVAGARVLVHLPTDDQHMPSAEMFSQAHSVEMFTMLKEEGAVKLDQLLVPIYMQHVLFVAHMASQSSSDDDTDSDDDDENHQHHAHRCSECASNSLRTAASTFDAMLSAGADLKQPLKQIILSNEVYTLCCLCDVNALSCDLEMGMCPLVPPLLELDVLIHCQSAEMLLALEDLYGVYVVHDLLRCYGDCVTEKQVRFNLPRLLQLLPDKNRRDDQGQTILQCLYGRPNRQMVQSIKRWRHNEVIFF